MNPPLTHPGARGVPGLRPPDEPRGRAGAPLSRPLSRPYLAPYLATYLATYLASYLAPPLPPPWRRQLSRLSHDQDPELAMGAIFGLGIVSAGSNNSRVAGLLRQLRCGPWGVWGAGRGGCVWGAGCVLDGGGGPWGGVCGMCGMCGMCVGCGGSTVRAQNICPLPLTTPCARACNVCCPRQ